MPSRLDAPSARTFDRFYEEFRAAAGGPPLSHVLVLLPPFSPTTPLVQWCYADIPPWPGSTPRPESEPIADWRDDTHQFGSVVRLYRHLFYGDLNQLGRFVEIARLATPTFHRVALHALGDRRDGGGLALSRSFGNEHKCWLRLLHGFMWQWQKHPWSPLQGRPYEWRGDFLHGVPYDDTSVPPQNAPLVCSLPFDVFRCSIEFIEALRRIADAEAALSDQERMTRDSALVDKLLSEKQKDGPGRLIPVGRPQAALQGPLKWLPPDVQGKYEAETPAGKSPDEPEPPTASGTEAPASPSPEPVKRLKEPRSEAFFAYELHKVHGWNQDTIAREIAKRTGKTGGQGQISKWIKAVRLWLEAGNAKPESKPSLVPTDPGKLDATRAGQNYARRKSHP